jgi:hypothetical protein
VVSQASHPDALSVEEASGLIQLCHSSIGLSTTPVFPSSRLSSKPNERRSKSLSAFDDPGSIYELGMCQS